MGMLDGKVAVVTDSARGMGRQIALLMAREGARVVVNDAGPLGAEGKGDPSIAEELVQKIRDMGGEAVANSDSPASWEGSHSLIQTALEQFGRIDILVNHASDCELTLLGSRIFDLRKEDWEAVRRAYLMATFFCTRAALPRMKAQRRGRLIHFTSTGGLIGSVGQTHCGSVKMAVAGFSRNVAIEMERYQVTSNCIAPCTWSDPAERIEKTAAEEVAPLAVFLSSDAAQNLSGQIFGVWGKEILLFSQPRIVRSIHNSQGWTVERLTRMLEPAMRPHFASLDSSDSYFSWDATV